MPALYPGTWVDFTEHIKASAAELCRQHGINAKIEGYTNIGSAICKTPVLKFPIYCNQEDIIKSKTQEATYPPQDDSIESLFSALNAHCTLWD
jgi:hypothetical protein